MNAQMIRISLSLFNIFVLISASKAAVLSDNGAPISTLQSQPEPIPHHHPGNETSRQQQPAAPYAIEDKTQQQQAVSTKNLVFRLSLVQASQDDVGHQGHDHDSMSLTNRNGSIGGSSLDLRTLLNALSTNNSFTSEILMDHQNPNTVNITISNLQNAISDETGHLFLDDLINESRSALNGSSTLVDNHRFITTHPARSKAPVVLVNSASTVPPIRQILDKVADNFTIKRIAEEANVFALHLLHQLNIEKLGSHNLVQSPFSVYQGLALLLSGANGETSRELDRVLLGNKQSIYESTRLTHEQDRSRLLASFNEIVNQLYQRSGNHLQDSCRNVSAPSSAAMIANADCLSSKDSGHYRGGSETQHLIVANNLLISPNAYEIATDFKNLVSNLYDNTALTRVEVGSTESIQVLNSWARQATLGLIPAIFNKRSTFDEFNVMTLLSTSWLAQEWRDNFRLVGSSLKTSIKLKGQSIGLDGSPKARRSFHERNEPLLEFVDDNKNSHFVDYIESEPTRNIHHYHVPINGLMADVVSVQFRNSNQRLVVLTPLSTVEQNGGNVSPMVNYNQTSSQLIGDGQLETESSTDRVELPDMSQLSKLIAAMAGNPRKAMKSLWTTIAPDILTIKVYQRMKQAFDSQRSQTNGSGINNQPSDIPPLVRLSVPLIKIEADASLSASLNHIGLVNSFDPTQANFIGINGHPFNYNKLHLSNVMYKTTFNLNEYGINYDRTIKTLESMRISATRGQQTEAGSGLKEGSRFDHSELVDEVKLSKPFLYLICDVKTKLVLYTGVVRNPAN